MKVDITPLHLGAFAAFEKSGFTHKQNVGVKISAPCVSWLIRLGDRLILVDTGTPDDETVERWHHHVFRSTPRQNLRDQLALFDIEPEDIETVVFTHLHYDHSSNVALFPKARFIAQEEELRYAVTPLAPHRLFYDLADGLQPEWIGVLDRFDTVAGDQQVTDGVDLVFLPGHTPGSQGVRVSTEVGDFLIAGDTVPLYDLIEDPATFSGTFVSLTDYLSTLRRVRSSSWHVLPSHDERVFDDEMLAGVAAPQAPR
jgi:N-acyl homoserine lactone hydrolase